jgi:methionyl-tRNA formyltransferase
MAQTRYHGDVYRIHHAQALDESHNETPGTVLRVEKDAIIIAALAGAVSLDMIQAPGKRVMSVSDFLRGHEMCPGDRFEDFS